MNPAFLNLPEDKQASILNAFLKEFAKNDYEKASLSAVIKGLGIAKGSIYQYFGSKLELYKLLRENCVQEKMSYVGAIDQSDYWDFWDYYREMYVQGLRFDLERPLHAQFLFRSSQDRSNPEMAKMLKENYLKSLLHFGELVEKEMENQLINNELDPQFVATSIINQGQGLKEYLSFVLDVDIQSGLEEGNTLFEDEKDRILKYVDQSIDFFRKAFS